LKSFKPSYVASSNDYAEFKKEKRKEQTKDALFRIGVAGSSVYASKLLLDTDAGQSVANKLFKGHALKQLYQFENGNFFDTKINKRINLGDISLNAARAVEELSPFKILRTFHVSSFLFPIASGKNAKTTISADLIDLDVDYYRGLIKKYGTGLHQNTIDIALNQGLVLDAGKLKTQAGETLIEHARLVHLNSDIAGASHDNSAGAFVNRIYEKFRNVTGVRSNRGFDDILQSDLHKVGVIAGNSTKEIYGNWTRSYIRMAMEPAYKLVNKPMEFLTEYIDHIGHAVNPTWKSISEKFGMSILPERFVGSTREALWTIAKKGAIRSAQAKVGFVLADAAVRTLAPNTSAYSKGLFEGLATFAVNTHIKFAEAWSDNFQELKQKQEDLAPGSTSLFTLAGFPLAGAMAGGTLGYLKRAGHIGARGSQIGELLAKYNTEATTVISEKLALSFKARPVAKWAFLGALAASLPALPYLPGALVGKSSDELKREYSGEKEVAVRTNRWWASGSYEYEGTKIKYFRPHAYSSLIKNSSDLTIYGSQANEDRLNPVLHPFDYLRNPYRLEQQNASKTPYPVWGMDVSYGGFFGKIFEKTAGRLIKPDKLNPKILAAKDAYQESVDKQLSYTTDYNGFAIDSDINDFKQKSMGSAQDRGSLAALIKEREKEYGKFAGLLDKNAVGGDAPEVEGLRSEYASMVNLDNYNVTVDDADTVILEDKTGKEKRKIEIRLSGMDSPEVGGHENDPIDFLRFKQEQLYGKEATDILKKIFSEQSNISLAINKTEMSYGRYVGVLIGDNNKNLNLEVIKKGGATILPWGNTDLIKTKDLKAAEREAQSTAEGLWNLPRYQAVQLFNQMTGYRQTYNTLTRIDKLAMRPELASYVTYLNSLDSQKEELSQSQKEDVQKLAMYYNKSSKDNREMGNLLKNIGMTVSGDQITANGGGFLKGALVNGATALINQGFNLNSTEAQTFTVRKNVKDSEKQLIEGDMMYAPQSPTYSPHTEGIKFSYSSFTEFSGLKGWAGSLFADALGFDYKDKPTELARSGEATGIARRVKDLNLGGALGGTEFLRRALPQSGDTLYDRENPMQNDMPYWLPSKADDFYTDFRTGNPFTKVEQGEIRLPGAGYESRFKELQGLDPKDYPDIHKYKILADVAIGSTQYYNMKDRMDARHRAGTLTDYEENLYKTITEQTQERGIFKQFDPYKTDEDLKGYGELDRLKSSFWQTVTHNSENPLEPLTFFRPAGKFIHKRTATEDYVSSQLLGNDMAMWTKPYAHMIKPTINKLTAIGNENFIPQETRERRNIDEYFEALDYIKKRKLYKQYVQDGNMGEAEIVKGQYLSNPFGAITMNLGSDKEMTKSYIAFNGKDRQYYSAFSSERNPEEREKIINMLPAVQAELMSKIWKRRDTIQNSQDNNKDISESIHNLIIEEHTQTVDDNKDAYKRYKNSEAAKHSSFEEYLSDEAAEKIVTRRTGMPSEDFVGWDPRIDINDIKLKTLMIGKEDVREFGFWQSDEDKVNRMFVLENNSKQIDNINAIKRDMQSANMDREIIKNRLYKAGIKVSSMSSSPALDDNVDIFIE